jgi:hypothetical protein
MALSDDQKAMLRLLAQSEQGYDDIASLTGSTVDEVRAKVREALTALDSGLGDDQKAMLRLLAQREAGYDDIAALTGTSVEDVRAKVNGALSELGGSGERPSPPPPPPPEAPAPPPPPKPKPKAAAERPPRTERASRSGFSLPGLPEDKGARQALAAAGAIVLVLILLLATGVLGGGDDSDPGGDDTTPVAQGAPGDGGKEPTEAVLEPVGDLDAGGRALFGRAGRAVVLLVRADGLPASPKSRSYTVSVARGEQRLPLIAAKVGADGVINGRFEVATQVLGLLAAGFDEMEVALVDDDRLRVALAQAQKSGDAPDYGGATVLSGAVTGPIVEAGGDEG